MRCITQETNCWNYLPSMATCGVNGTWVDDGVGILILAFSNFSLHHDIATRLSSFEFLRLWYYSSGETGGSRTTTGFNAAGFRILRWWSRFWRVPETRTFSRDSNARSNASTTTSEKALCATSENGRRRHKFEIAAGRFVVQVAQIILILTVSSL